MNPIDLGPRYEYLRDLGSGGMGEVVLVRDSYLKKEVALKLLHHRPREPGEIEQIQGEFALLSQIEHPGIAKAYDFGYLGERLYFTSEFIEGEHLGVNGASADIPTFLSQALDITDSVSFLHRGGILHLDIKPTNIIVPRGTERRRPVLIDFGLYRRGGSATVETRIKGSIPYMAPEYFRREAPGPWTDVYALGVTFYRIAAGRFPRPAHSPPGDGSRARKASRPG